MRRDRTRDTAAVAAYVIADVDVTDPETYKEYTAQTPGSIAAHGGKFIVRGGRFDVLEGNWEPGRVVLIEFPSMEAALGWYRSENYQELAKIRRSASSARILVVDGV
jgi:uncharacterized protein (DUF1330 family)